MWLPTTCRYCCSPQWLLNITTQDCIQTSLSNIQLDYKLWAGLRGNCAAAYVTASMYDCHCSFHDWGAYNGVDMVCVWGAECGGKNFHFVHKSADLTSVVHHTIRSAYEYSGQKCSACSRLYIAESVWPEFKQQLLVSLKDVKVGSPLDNESFLSAVIDNKVSVTCIVIFLRCYE